MRLRNSWIFFFFFLIYTVPLLLPAQELAIHKELSYNLPTHDLILSEQLTQQLKKRYLRNKSTRWLFKLLFTDTPGSQKKLFVAPYLPYEGKTIGLIQLDKQKGWNVDAFTWKRLASIVLMTTKDWVILDELSFMSGDSVVLQHLIDSQDRLNKLPHIKQARITVQERNGSDDTVDIRIYTKDRFPISLDINPNKSALSITHHNLVGWGHVLKNEFLYDQGIGYGITYRAPNIKQSGIIGELQYRSTQKKGIKRLRVFKNFTDEFPYAGKIEANKTRQTKRRVLDGSTRPQKTSFSFHHQCIWLGTTMGLGGKNHQGRFFLIGKVDRQHFVQRPTVTQSTNRYFHHYVFGAASLGVSNKRHYKDRLVHGVGGIENIPYGSKLNLIGGYQFGEFVNRPYLCLGFAQGRRTAKLGHLYGAVQVGGFLHKKEVEQGILQLRLAYFTPLLGIGHQWIRQFIRINYLGGHNMLTGELISTNLQPVARNMKDPFPGGTKRLHLGLETVLLTPRRFAGCQVAALSFIEAVKLQDAQGKVRQSSFCKALGIGFRCAHPRLAFGSLQIKLGYSPLTQNMYFTINTMTTVSDNLDIGEPGTIPFQEY